MGGAVAPRGAKKTDRQASPAIICHAREPRNSYPEPALSSLPGHFQQSGSSPAPGRMGGWEGWKRGGIHYVTATGSRDPRPRVGTGGSRLPLQWSEDRVGVGSREEPGGNIEIFYKPHGAALQPGWRLISPQPLPSPWPRG